MVIFNSYVKLPEGNKSIKKHLLVLVISLSISPGFETSTVGVATVGQATTSFAARVASRPLASPFLGRSFGVCVNRQKRKDILTSFVNDSGLYKDMQFETHSSDQV